MPQRSSVETYARSALVGTKVTRLQAKLGGGMRGSSFHRPLALTLVYGLPPQGKRLVDSGGVTGLGFAFSVLRSARTMNT